jgi:hypothetical protein
MSNGKGDDRRPQLVSNRAMRLRWWLAFEAPKIVKVLVRAIGL